MGRKREFKGTPAQQAMARFLEDVTERAGLDTLAKVVEGFPRSGSRSTWAEYLNGSKLIPKDLLGQVLMEVRRRRPDHWRESLVTEAHALWKGANEDTVSSQDSADTELVSVYRRLAENADALRKAQEVEVRSERVIRLMNQRAGQQELRIADLEREVEHLEEKEREQATYRLEQARFRLTRIEDELERARSDRYTVEQAQRALLREQQDLRREFEQLRQVAADLDFPETEPTRLPDLLTLEVSEEEADRAVDEELDHVGTDREERGLLLSDVLGHTGAESREEDGVLAGTVVISPSAAPEPADQPDSAKPTSEVVQGLSRTTPDNPATSRNVSLSEPGTRTKRRAAVLVGALVVVLGAAVPSALEWMNGPSGGVPSAGRSSKSGPSTKPTNKGGSSPLPTHSDDQVADIGDTVINTPAIMKLRDCNDSPVGSVKSHIELDPAPPPLGGKADFKMTLRRVSGEACRYNLGSNAAPFSVSALPKGIPWDGKSNKYLSWNTAMCVPNDAPSRWAKLDTARPLTITYHWDFRLIRDDVAYSDGTPVRSEANCHAATFDKPGYTYYFGIETPSLPGSDSMEDFFKVAEP